MGRLLKWTGIGLGTAGILAIAVFYAWSEAIIAKTYPLPPSHIRASRDPAAITRGQRFAMAYGCGDCHGANLQGAFISDFGISSRNLTILAKSFSDVDFDRAVRRGFRPDGSSVSEFMPSDSFQFMPDADMADIVSYIRSLKPAGKDIGFPSYSLKDRLAFLQGRAHTNQYWFGFQKPALDLGPRYARGRVMAMTACGECHMASLTGAPSFIPPPRPPDLLVVASYEQTDFIRFMRTGKAAGVRELPLMSDTARARFSKFNDAELGAIYDYLAARGRKLTGSGG